MSRLLRTMGLTASALATLVGLAAMVLWELGRWRLTAMVANLVPMAPITGLLFAALGSAVVARGVWPEAPSTRRLEIAASVFVIVVAFWVAANAWFAMPLPWEAWFRPPEMQVGPVPLGRIALSTAVALALTGVSILARGLFAARASAITVLGPGASLGIAFAALFGFAVGTPTEYTPTQAPMALLTAINLLLLNAGALLSEGAVAWLRSLFAFGSTGPERADNRRFGLRLAGVVLLLVLLILSLAVLFMRNELGKAQEAVNRELDAVANLKAADIIQWREERFGEGRFLQRTPHVASDIASFLARPGDATARQRVEDWLEPIRGGTRYRAVFLFDGAGALRLSVPRGIRVSSEALDDPGHRLHGAVIRLSEIHFPSGESRPHLDLVVPISAGNSSLPVATIVLEIDPTQYLYPQVATWPSISPTAEAYLVRRDGDSVVFLSPTRFAPDSALTRRYPLNAPLLPEAKAARGEMGATGGLDYRGHTVLATARTIPNSSWILVAKIDQAEVYGPIRRQATETGLLFTLIILSIGLAAAHLWRERYADTLARGLATERDRATLAERLSVVMREANDIILLFDREGRIVESNERARAVYGYTDEELRTLTVGGLRADKDRVQLFRNIDRLLGNSDGQFESVHRRKDGSTLFVEASGRAVTIGGEPLVIIIFRDVTERKAHARQIERLNRLYASLSQVNQAVVRATNSDALLEDVCRALVQAGGFKMAWTGAVDPSSHDVRCTASFGDEKGYLKSIRVTIDDEPGGRGPTGTAIREGRPVVAADFTIEALMEPWQDAAAQSGFRCSIGLPVELGGAGRGALTVYAAEPHFFGAEEVALLEETVGDLEFGLRSIEEREKRQQAEEALRQSEDRLRRLGDNLPDSYVYQYTIDKEGPRFLYVSNGVERVHGLKPQDVLRDASLFHAQTDSGQSAESQSAEEMSSRTMTDFMMEHKIRRTDGQIRWIQLRSRPRRTRDGRIIWDGVATDVTDRKAMERMLADHLEEARARNEELSRFNRAMVDRELRMVELKHLVNALLARLGEPPRFVGRANQGPMEPEGAAGSAPAESPR